MNEADFALHANIPPGLAAMVIAAAFQAGVSLRSFRADDRRPHLVEARHRLILLARDRGFTSSAIGRALARDHSTIISADRCARALVAAGLLTLHPPAEPLTPPVQLDFLPGPLFEVARAA